MWKLDSGDQSKRMRKFDLLIVFMAIAMFLVISLLQRPAQNPIPEAGTEITEEAGK
jgi:hypothetical protein